MIIYCRTTVEKLTILVVPIAQLILPQLTKKCVASASFRSAERALWVFVNTLHVLPAPPGCFWGKALQMWPQNPSGCILELRFGTPPWVQNPSLIKQRIPNLDLETRPLHNLETLVCSFYPIHFLPETVRSKMKLHYHRNAPTKKTGGQLITASNWLYICCQHYIGKNTYLQSLMASVVEVAPC